MWKSAHFVTFLKYAEQKAQSKATMALGKEGHIFKYLLGGNCPVHLLATVIQRHNFS